MVRAAARYPSAVKTVRPRAATRGRARGLSIRSTLTALVVALGVVLLVAVGLLISHARGQAVAADRYAVADGVRTAILTLGIDLVEERTRTYVDLMAPAAPGAAPDPAVARTRADVDRSLAAAGRALDGSGLNPVLSAVSRAQMAALGELLAGLREEAQAVRAMAAGDRRSAAARRWLDAMSALMGDVQRARLELARAVSIADPFLTAQSGLRHFAWITADRAGQVAALVAGGLAQWRTPQDGELAAIALADAQSELAWEFVEDIARLNPRSPTGQAVTAADHAYFGRVMTIREQIYRATRRREPSPVGLAAWNERAEAAAAAFEAIQSASKTATGQYVADLRRQRDRAFLVWSIIGVLGAAAVVTSLLLLHERILAPLRVVTGTLTCLGQGDLATRVPRPLRDDEIGGTFLALRALKAQALRAERLRAAKERDDLRAKAAIEDREARLRAVVDSVTEGILTFDLEEGRVESANAAATKLLGHEGGSLVGRRVVDLVPPAVARQFEEEARRYRATGRSPLLGAPQTTTGLHAEGRQVPLEVTVTETRLADRTILTATLRDIAAREAVDRMKGEFVSTVSHELRTPLTSIVGSLGLLLEMPGGDLGPESRPLVEMAHRNAERLILLVNDILDMQRIESSGLEFSFQPVDLVAVAREAVAAGAGLAGQSGVAVTLAAPPAPLTAQADPGRVFQVMANLLSNAVKFSQPGQEVRLEISAQGRMAQVAVLDHGPGIPDSFRPRIFQKFAQADGGDTRARGGTGLGLSICKAIVERHGGEIGFASAPGNTRFFFTLPLQAALSPAGERP